ncbi:MAG TPA: SRPBCC family protein, partial [Microthrixaceae bacterium]|nr:SRPBCC family protein [Microthrixaceae bacterium]
QGAALVYRSRPQGADPNRSLFEVMCLEQVPVARYDDKWEVEPQFFEDYRQGDIGQILTQDFENTENVTIGMHSPSFDGHRLSTEQEMTIYNQHRVADRYLWADD